MNRWAGVTVAVLMVMSAQAQNLDAAAKANVENAIHRVMQQTGVPSAQVGIVRGGQAVYAGAFGDARLASDSSASMPSTLEMRYAIGSISKQFTATCLLLLQERGKLKLDDPVSKWFPELTRSSDITIRNLITHTSGYSDYAPQDYTIPAWTKPTTPLEVVHAWASKPLDFEPGTKWQYSNTNFVLAGLIVEKVSGITFHDFLWKNVIKPLHLHNTLDLDLDRSKMEPTGYKRNALGPLRPAIPEAKGWYFADGELAMPVRTLLEWDMSLIERKLLKPGSYDEMFREQMLKDGNGSHYSLGMQVGTRDGHAYLSHSGEIGGFVAMNLVLPADGIAIAVLTNQDASRAAGEITRVLVPLILGATDASPAETATTKEVRGVLTAFQTGQFDRSLFTENASFYFSQTAIDDFHSSLAPLGALESLTEDRSPLRGGMQMRVYTAKFAKKSVSVSTYWMPDGKIEQFLVEGKN